MDVLQLKDFENCDDPVRLEDQIQRLTEAMGLIKKGIRMLVELDPNEPRVQSVKKGVLRVLSPYEEMLKRKKLTLKRVKPVVPVPPRRRRTSK